MSAERAKGIVGEGSPRDRVKCFVGHLRRAHTVLVAGFRDCLDVAALVEAGATVTAIDPSPERLQEVRRLANVPVAAMDAAHLGFASGCFNAVWADGVLDSLPKSELPAMLAHLAEMMGLGTLYLSVEEAKSEGDTGYNKYEIQLALELGGYNVLEWHHSPERDGRRTIHLYCVRRRYETPRIGANAVIFDDLGRVLLTKRADNSSWCLPGGHMDIGEMIAETVVRETEEETGLEVKVVRAIGIYSKPYPDFKYRNIRNQIMAITFLCRVMGGRLRLTNETSDYAYFPPDQLPSPMLAGHDIRVLDAVKNDPDVFVR